MLWDQKIQYNIMLRQLIQRDQKIQTINASKGLENLDTKLMLRDQKIQTLN